VPVEDCVMCDDTDDLVGMTTCDQLNCSVINIEMAGEDYMIAGMIFLLQQFFVYFFWLHNSDCQQVGGSSSYTEAGSP